MLVPRLSAQKQRLVLQFLGLGKQLATLRRILGMFCLSGPSRAQGELGERGLGLAKLYQAHPSIAQFGVAHLKHCSAIDQTNNVGGRDLHTHPIPLSCEIGAGVGLGQNLP